MDIVPQFQPLSHSLFQPRLLLPAPAPHLLLPATVPTRAQDTILMRNDPTPAPFVAKDRANMPPELLKIIGHLPTPDELDHWLDTRRAEIFARLATRRERAI